MTFLYRLLFGMMGAVSNADEEAAQAITANVLNGHTRFLSSDALMGRGPATPGDALTQAYVASQFERIGLEVVSGAPSYLQPFEMMGIESHPTTLTAHFGERKMEWVAPEDWIGVAGQAEKQTVIDRAELVFVGYGIKAPEFQWDDYKGQNFSGKVLVMLNNDPSSDPNLFGGVARQRYGRWDYKYELAASVHALGAIIVHTTESAGYPWPVVQSSWSGEKFALSSNSPNSLALRAWVTQSAVEKWVKLMGRHWNTLVQLAESRQFTPIPLGVTVSTSFRNSIRRCSSANVLGVLRGSDPQLSKEWVVVTAHHDHLGIRPGSKEDSIYNGAIDNASGVAGLLAIAEAMRRLPKTPKRSILFAALGGEEQGLLGSQFLVEHFPAPLGKVAANLNLDGLNVWGRTRDVTIVGYGKSSLDAEIARLARLQGRVTKADPLSDRGFFYRSDQFNFAKKGIPAAYFGSGLDYIGREPSFGRKQREKWEAQHYHQPSDELDGSWDWSGAVEDLQLYFHLARKIAEDKNMPAWNRGDEFQAARQAALQALQPSPWGQRGP